MREDRLSIRRRIQVHLRAPDVALLDLLVSLEGGNRSQAAARALVLYCERVEALQKLTERAPK